MFGQCWDGLASYIIMRSTVYVIWGKGLRDYPLCLPTTFCLRSKVSLSKKEMKSFFAEGKQKGRFSHFKASPSFFRRFERPRRGCASTRPRWPRWPRNRRTNSTKKAFYSSRKNKKDSSDGAKVTMISILAVYQIRSFLQQWKWKIRRDSLAWVVMAELFRADESEVMMRTEWMDLLELAYDNQSCFLFLFLALSSSLSPHHLEQTFEELIIILFSLLTA